MTNEKPDIPFPYSPDGKGGAGEGRGAPEAPIKNDEPEKNDKK